MKQTNVGKAHYRTKKGKGDNFSQEVKFVKVPALQNAKVEIAKHQSSSKYLLILSSN